MGVLAWIKSRSVTVADLEPIIATEQVKCHLDASGYLQFRHWRLYDSAGLAGQEADVLLYQQTVTVAYEEAPLIQYQVETREDATAFVAVHMLRELSERFPSTQLHLWELRQFTWHKALPVPCKQRRRSQVPLVQQAVLFPDTLPVRHHRRVRHD